uniref:FERM domain-containing protein n=1 Tax=Parastrongyloides trichosuri TaxID=131310 RepID=A0A0N4ZXF5_PARTI
MNEEIYSEHADFAYMDYEIEYQAPDPYGDGYIRGVTIYRDEMIQYKQDDCYKRIESIHDYQLNQPECIKMNPNIEEVLLESLLMKAYPKQKATENYYKKYINKNVYKINTAICHPKICSIEILTPNALIPMHITSYIVGSYKQSSQWLMLKRSNIYEIEWGTCFQMKQAGMLKHFGIRGEIEILDSKDRYQLTDKYEFPWKRVKYNLAFGNHQAVKLSLGNKLISSSNRIKEIYSHIINKGIMKDLTDNHPKFEVRKLTNSVISHVQFSKTVNIQKIAKNVSNPLKIVKESEFERI